MGIFRSKAPAPPLQLPSVYDIGRYRTAEDFYAVDRTVQEDVAAKKAANDKSRKKYMKRVFFDGRLFKKYEADKAAYEAAQKAPHQIRKDFYQGACEAFLQDNRADNIQHILSKPQDFLCDEYSNVNKLTNKTLITLLSASDNPDAVPDTVLANVTDERKQEILDRALINLISEYRNVEGNVSSLLKAGAKGSDGLSATLAIALHYNHPDAVTNMLIARGATLEGALERMREYPKFYGDTPEKVEDRQHRRRMEAEIRALREEFTRESGPSSPVSAKAAAFSGKYDELKIASARPR